MPALRGGDSVSRLLPDGGIHLSGMRQGSEPARVVAERSCQGCLEAAVAAAEERAGGAGMKFRRSGPEEQTQVAMNGVQELAIMKQTRHKSAAMLRRYVRDASMFRDNASARAGL
jgi:hypothetical protein